MALSEVLWLFEGVNLSEGVDRLSEGVVDL